METHETHETPEYIDEIAAASRIGGVTPASLRRWRHRRQGPPYHRRGKSIRYRVDELDAWIAAQRVEPAAATAPTTEGP